MKTRHRVRLPLRCPVIFASDEFVGEGTVVDLGVPGCAVESHVAPLPREYVRLHVLMPDEGRTAWSRTDKGTMGRASAVRSGVFLNSPMDNRSEQVVCFGP
jgi:hypothetical protein